MISPFEYITVLISIILGMGITEILSSAGNVILRWNNVKLYWPHTVLVLLVFVFHFQEWWVVFELRSYQYWRLPIFLFVILYPVNLYILARILFPQKWKNKGTDLRAFYYENCRRIFLFIFSLAVLSILDNIFFHSIPVVQQLPQILLAIICSVIVFSHTKSPWVHHLIIALLLIATVVTFVIEWDIFLIENKPG
jgi:hypothetical protein